MTSIALAHDGQGAGAPGRAGRTASLKEQVQAPARGPHTGSADVAVTTGTTDPVLITLTRPEGPAPWS